MPARPALYACRAYVRGSWDFCEYGGRRYTGYTTLSINRAGISCDSRISIGHTLICCDEHDLDPCPLEAQEGSSCTPEERGECYVPGPGANIEHGFVNGQICACDPPGPKWRCATICQLCDEGLHSLDPENFDRVDCAPEDAFGGTAGAGSGE